jgi:hypothetical protein
MNPAIKQVWHLAGLLACWLNKYLPVFTTVVLMFISRDV